MQHFLKSFIAVFVIMCFCTTLLSCENRASGSEVTVRMEEYKQGLKNPLKGIRDTWSFTNSAYMTSLVHWYVKWYEIEGVQSDGVQKVLEYSDSNWQNAETFNCKIIPRVYLNWPNMVDESNGNYWPSDMQTGDYDSEQFKTRLEAMIRKMGIAWDNDPRVAYINMGIIGQWGEQHDPTPSDEVQILLAENFKKYFKNKLVMVRYPQTSLFTDYDFGISWDEWGSDMQWSVWDNIQLATQPPYENRWKTAVFGGENTNNLYGIENQGGNFYTYGKDQPFTAEEAFTTAVPQMVDYSRLTHTNHVGTPYGNLLDADVKSGMDVFQNTLGYQFVIDTAKYSSSAAKGEKFSVSFDVTNTGSSPLYYDWPVQISLLDKITKKPVWNDMFEGVSASDWMPGELWDTAAQQYGIPAKKYTVSGDFIIPENIKKDDYILAITILDPAGLSPSGRFACKNSVNGGYTVLGLFGVDRNPDKKLLVKYDDLQFDYSIRYYKNISQFKKCVSDTGSAASITAGDNTQSWTAADDGAHSVTIDLGSEKKTRSIEIAWEAAAGYTIKTSADGITWVSNGRKVYYAKKNTTRNYLIADNVRYVKVFIEKSLEQKPAKIYSINIYGE